MRNKSDFKGSLGYCQETCPDVERAFSDAWTEISECAAVTHEAEAVFYRLLAKVKEVGTEKLREALCEAVHDKDEAEGERDDLQRRVSDLESEVDDLRDQVETLERELEGATA